MKTGAEPVGKTEVERLAWYLSAVLVLSMHLPIRHSDGSVMYVMSDGSVRPSCTRSDSDDRGKKRAPWRTEDRYPSSQVQADDPADE